LFSFQNNCVQAAEAMRP